MRNFAEDRQFLIWKTAGAQTIRICDMVKSHIQNTIIGLCEKQEACIRLRLGIYEYEGKPALDWIDILRKELDFREKQKKKDNKEVEEDILIIL
jgi:hypothetical protein